MSILADRLLAVHRALDSAGIPHAIGGAIALGYCVREPRGTRDLDVNVFLDPVDAERVLAAMPPEVRVRSTDVAALRRDGQVRLRWDETPVDLFLNVAEFHEGVAQRVRVVPFEGVDVPVLDCVSLAVFKAFFNRTKDWADIEAMVEAGKLDGAVTVRWLDQLLGPDDEVTKRFAGLTS